MLLNATRVRERLTLSVLGVLLLFSFSAHAQAPPCPGATWLQGAWAEQDGGLQLSFEADRVVLWEKGLLRMATVLRREPCKLYVRDQGVLATWALEQADRAIRFDRGKGAITLERLSQVPATLDTSPFPLPSPAPIAPETAQEIARTLAARADRDVEALRSTEGNRSEILHDNIHYLREVVGRYGWIDIPRFGKAGAAAAILIAKHSSDLRILQDALPIVEKDARENGGGKELVAITVDEVLIATGHRQKYGTQITEDAQGKPFVIPVEDVTKVDEYRKELGIPAWSDYLAKASKALYDGTPIRIPGPLD